MKKILSLSIATASAMLVVGCGSSSSSVETSTGYYLDSAVAGVNYKCGNQEGITGANGEFNFKKDTSCDFSVAGVQLREIPADNLVDGIKVVEDNISVAMLLQSIDSDGNPNNGIQITQKVVETLQEALKEVKNVNEVLTNRTVMQAVVAQVGEVVDGVSGELVSEEDVIAHLTQTQTEVTKEFLAGKTFYSVDLEEDEDKEIIKLEFNADVTQMRETELSDGDSYTHNIEIEGNKLIFSEDNDGSYTIISQADGYIYADDRNADGSKDGIGHRLYTSQADAQTYLDSLSSGDTEPITKFSTEWLNGKTLYFVQYDDFGYDGEDEPGMQWNMARMDFTENTMSWTEYDLPDTSTHTFNYSITSDGKIDIGEDFNEVIEFQSQTDDYIKVCEDGDCNTYLFFDESKARAFRDSQNN